MVPVNYMYCSAMDIMVGAVLLIYLNCHCADTKPMINISELPPPDLQYTKIKKFYQAYSSSSNLYLTCLEP